MVLLHLSLLACRAGAVAPPVPPSVVTDPMLQIMIHSLADEHPEGFGPAIEWLVAHPDLARPALRAEIVEHPDHIATARGLRALARIGAAEDVAAIVATFHAATTLSGVWAAAAALGEHPHGAGALIIAAADPNDTIAGAAASVLGNRKVEAGRAAVEALLTRADPNVRYRAVRALGELGAEPSRAALLAARKNEHDPDVREALAAVGVR